MRRLLLVLSLLMLAPGVAHAGGGGVDTSGCPGYAEGTTITMLDSCFSGVAHFAPAGTTITVRNEGFLPHTLTAIDGSFDTGQVAPGGSVELTFDQPGVFRVFCSLHGTASGEGMAGVLLVGEAVPPTVASPLDAGVVSEAVAAEFAPVLSAVDAQREAIQSLRLTELQARLLDALDQANTEPVPASTSGPGLAVVGVIAGLALGLAVTALLTARRAGESSPVERLEVEVPV